MTTCEEIRPIIESVGEPEPEKETCCYCGCSIEDDATRDANGELYCEDCASDHLYYCEECGEWHDEHSSNWLDRYDRHVCDECLEANYYQCRDCDEWLESHDAIDVGNSSDYMYICDSCLNNYTTCDDCGDWMHVDDLNNDGDYVYCDNCHERNVNHIIRSYHEAPSRIFYNSDGTYRETPRGLYLGVELEMENATGRYTNDEAAGKIRDELNGADYEDEDLIYYNHDGSLNDGMELITQPMEYDFLAALPWADALKTASDCGMRGHDTETAGLHVHVSRGALGITVDQQNDTIARIITIVENNWPDILRFSRRSESALSRWAARYLSDCDTPSVEVCKGVMYSGDRYRCVNLTNYHTIEFRMFRASLRPETFAATLEFVYRLVTYCVNCTDEQANIATLIDAMGECSDNLRAYMARRVIVSQNKNSALSA